MLNPMLSSINYEAIKKNHHVLPMTGVLVADDIGHGIIRILKSKDNEPIDLPYNVDSILVCRQ